ncbi:MAG: SDR family oxidoreductase [Verrucomicrobia bacterium]|nr:SDR family oxidoreductase [Verrucomicrobiota bacterium]MBU1909130.1 SDR family oxidoreductase [Verrucomicrobiota bacterium]
MKTILITGAGGFLGGVLAQKLTSAGHVVGTGRQHADRRVDLRDPEALRRLLAETTPDVVIHTAAYRDPDFCEEHPEETRRLNVEPVRLLASGLPPSAFFVLISTDYVFDGAAPPYRENSPRHPLGLYGRSKMEAEDLALARPGALVVRIPLLIGVEPAHRGPSGFILQMARQILDGQPADVDDVLVRFPTWTEDVAEAVAFLLEKRAVGVFHMSGARGATRYAWTVETARLLGRATDHLKPLKIPFPRPARRPLNAELATGKLRQLGFDRFTDFAEVARRILSALGIFQQ